MITIRKPKFSELDYVAKLWADEKTMEDTGGIHILKKENYEDFYKNKVEPTDGLSQFFLIFNNEEPIGEVAFNNLHKETNTAGLSIRIEYTKRRSSYAKQALKLFLDYYFYQFKADILEDSVGSPSGIKFLTKINFPSKDIKSLEDVSPHSLSIIEKYNIPLKDYITNDCEYFVLTKQQYQQGILDL